MKLCEPDVFLFSFRSDIPSCSGRAGQKLKERGVLSGSYKVYESARDEHHSIEIDCVNFFQSQWLYRRLVFCHRTCHCYYRPGFSVYLDYELYLIRRGQRFFIIRPELETNAVRPSELVPNFFGQMRGERRKQQGDGFQASLFTNG